MSDLNILFCPEDLLTHRKKPSHLPLHGGPKAFAPDDGSEGDHTLTSLLQEQKDILQEQRVSKKGISSIGTWNVDEWVIEVSVAKGHHWQHFGQQKHGKTFLQPHEALYLLEQGSLELYYGGLPMSFQQAYMSLLSDDFTPDQYLVYTYFLRLGFIVLLHSSRVYAEGDDDDDDDDEYDDDDDDDNDEDDNDGGGGGGSGDGDGEGDDADDDHNNDDNDDDKDDDEGYQPMISPVAHLWTSKDGCRPLVRPEDATSTAAVLSKLQVIKNQRLTDADCMEPSPAKQSLQIVFDVYQPGLNNFKKTDPGSPDFCVTICRFCDPPPTLAALTVLSKECSSVPLKIALVDGGSISFYSVLDKDSPTFITRG